MAALGTHGPVGMVAMTQDPADLAVTQGHRTDDCTRMQPLKHEKPQSHVAVRHIKKSSSNSSRRNGAHERKRLGQDVPNQASVHTRRQGQSRESVPEPYLELKESEVDVIKGSNRSLSILSRPSSNHSIAVPAIPHLEDGIAYPEGDLHAWLVVLASFSGMVASFGLINTVGTFQGYLSTHQPASYSPSSVGWIFGMYVSLRFFCGVQIVPVIDAKGLRWLLAAGTVLLLAGMVGAPVAPVRLIHQCGPLTLRSSLTDPLLSI